MDNILDSPAEELKEPWYLKKSRTLCRVYLILLFFCFLLSAAAKTNERFADVLVILLGLSLLVMLGMSPWGVYYSWRSKKNNEGHRRKRLTYAIAHWFIFVLLILVIVRFIMDMANLL